MGSLGKPPGDIYGSPLGTGVIGWLSVPSGTHQPITPVPNGWSEAAS